MSDQKEDAMMLIQRTIYPFMVFFVSFALGYCRHTCSCFLDSLDNRWYWVLEALVMMIALYGVHVVTTKLLKHQSQAWLDRWARRASVLWKIMIACFVIGLPLLALLEKLQLI